jgi:hypothetical protein
MAQATCGEALFAGCLHIHAKVRRLMHEYEKGDFSLPDASPDN